jgi:hypothetical protein
MRKSHVWILFDCAEQPSRVYDAVVGVFTIEDDAHNYAYKSELDEDMCRVIKYELNPELEV